MCTAISGFRHTGIVLPEADFILAATMDITFHTAPSEKPTPAQFLSELRYFFFCTPTTEEPPTSSFLHQSPTEIIQIAKVEQDKKRMT